MEFDARQRFGHKMDERGPYNFGGGKRLVTFEDEVEIVFTAYSIAGIGEENQRLNRPSPT